MSKASSMVNERMSERVNESKHALINTYTHQLIYSICSTSVESIRFMPQVQITVFYAKQSQFSTAEVRIQESEVKNI